MTGKRQAKNDPRDAALKKALADAPFDGWHDLDLALYFSEWADEKMLAALAPAKLKNMRVRDKIAAGVWARLMALAPHRAALSSALSFMAVPPRSLYLPKMVWATADKIWWAAGDTATDYNHYTKRALLSGVLTATTLYWLNDDSGGFENTRAFLDRRIDNVLSLGKALSSFRRRA